MEEIKQFVYDECIDGIDFRLQEQIEKEKQQAENDAYEYEEGQNMTM